MAAAAFIDSVHARAAFVQAQTEAGLDTTALQEDQVRALIVDLSTQQFAIADATAVTVAVTSGSWAQQQKQSLIAAIAEASFRRTGAFGKREQQACDCIENMLTESDWATNRNPDLTIEPKSMCVAKRMYQLGLVCPKETLLEKAASIVLAAHGGEHSAQDKQRACRQVKAFVKALDKRQRYPLPHQLVYPATPQELSSDKFQFAYGDDGPVNAPVDVDVYGMYTNMAYRRSHRSLRPSSDALGVSALAPSGGSNAMQAMVQQAMQPIFALANAFYAAVAVQPARCKWRRAHFIPRDEWIRSSSAAASECASDVAAPARAGSTAINAAARHASPTPRSNATRRGSASRRCNAARRGDAAGLATHGGAAC